MHCTPSLQGGTVVDEINRLTAQGKSLDTREALNIFLQVCVIVEYLHMCKGDEQGCIQSWLCTNKCLYITTALHRCA